MGAAKAISFDVDAHQRQFARFADILQWQRMNTMHTELEWTLLLPLSHIFSAFLSFSSTLISIWNVCHFHAFQNNNATVCRIFLAISFRLVLVGSFILSAYWNGFFIRSANMTREEEKERERATRIVSRFHLFYSPQPSHSHLHNISCDFLYILLFLCIFIFSSRLSSGFWCPWFLLCRLSALTNRCLPHIFQCVNAFDVAITTTISPSAEQ